MTTTAKKPKTSKKSETVAKKVPPKSTAPKKSAKALPKSSAKVPAKASPKAEVQPKDHRLHQLNVRFPWLKLVVLVAAMFVLAASVVAMLDYQHREALTNKAEVTTTPEPEEATPSESEQPSDTKVKEEATAEPESKPQTPEQPATQPTQNTTAPKPSRGGLIALTFDDGPSTYTTRLLQILREKGVKATFFVIGNMAQKSPDLVRQEIAEGHEVGSHTMTHANLKKSTIEGIKWEVAAMDELFLNILGVKPALMRPPYGNINDNVRTYVPQPLILWTVDTEDWKSRNTASVRQRAVADAFDGAVILMHDVYGTTVDAVAGIIDDLRAAGYEFRTVSELARERGIILKAGTSYGSFRP